MEHLKTDMRHFLRYVFDARLQQTSLIRQYTENKKEIIIICFNA